MSGPFEDDSEEYYRDEDEYNLDSPTDSDEYIMNEDDSVDIDLDVADIGDPYDIEYDR